MYKGVPKQCLGVVKKPRILGQIPYMKYPLIIRGSNFLLSNNKVEIPIYAAKTKGLLLFWFEFKKASVYSD